MSHRILAIDTTSEFGSLALLQEDRVLEEVPLRPPEGFAHILFQEIERLLARHRIALNHVDAFASASGPGSFTGVRIGLTAVKGLAEATGRRVIAVSNLQALAWFGKRPLRAVLLDARRGEVFGAVYDSNLHSVREETVTKLAEWLDTLPAGDLEIITPDPSILPDMPGQPILVSPPTLARAIGHIAMERFAAGLAQDPADIDANYVRRSDAELMWKE